MMDDERGLPDDRGGLLVANGIVNEVVFGIVTGVIRREAKVVM